MESCSREVALLGAQCLSPAKLRSTDSVNPRAVSRVRPRYRLYSRHRDIDGISTGPIPVCPRDASLATNRRKRSKKNVEEKRRRGARVWRYAPAHTTTTPHDPPHATIPPRDDPPTRHNATTHVRRQLKDLSPPCALYYPQNLERGLRGGGRGGWCEEWARSG
jgi:hypothetical protein